VGSGAATGALPASQSGSSGTSSGAPSGAASAPSAGTTGGSAGTLAVTGASGSAFSGGGDDASAGATSGSNSVLADADPEASGSSVADVGTTGSSDGFSDASVIVPSCAPGGPGMTNCGANRENCCTSLELPGGTYFRSYGTVYPPYDGGPIGMGHPGPQTDPATVSGFRLDKYLVTVARFRQFFNAWNNGSGFTPPAGSGKHAHVNRGNGLNATAGGFEHGWVASDNANIGFVGVVCPASSAGSFSTWTPSAGSHENLPMNCVNWYQAYAFCIWDGGFLPSEAELEYAAAGGDQQRLYPWGSTDPGTGTQYAIYDCDYQSGPTGRCTGVVNIAPVGTATLGAGLWGQLDLTGEVGEWDLDWWRANYVDPCTDCANITAPSDPNSSGRTTRGGGFGVSTLQPPSERFYSNPLYPGPGIRCARTP
jgi:formylglycine-generating enzyme required for sulfatase activity